MPVEFQIKNVKSLPDRVAETLAPHLQAYISRSAAPVQLPTTKTSASALGGGDQPGVNRNTPLSKECLVAALRATRVIVETGPRKEELVGGVQTAELSGGFLDAIEVIRTMASHE